MAQPTPLKEKFDKLTVTERTKFLSTIEPKITKSTFYRDLKTKPGTIPYERLQVYAGKFDCEVSELIDAFSKLKIKPIVKREQIGKKVGIIKN